MGRKFEFVGDGKERLYDDHEIAVFGYEFRFGEATEVTDGKLAEKFATNGHFKEHVATGKSFDYAVFKPNGTKAVKVFDEEAQAVEYIKGKEGYTIEPRER